MLSRIFCTKKLNDLLLTCLQVVFSITKGRSAKLVLQQIKTGSREEKLDALKNLPPKCTDPTFASQFINRDGLQLVISHVIGLKRQANHCSYYVELS